MSQSNCMSEKRSLCSSLSLCLFFSLFPSSHSLVRRSGRKTSACASTVQSNKSLSPLWYANTQTMSLLCVFFLCAPLFFPLFFYCSATSVITFFPFGMRERPIDETRVIVPQTTADKHNKMNAKMLHLCCHSSE